MPDSLSDQVASIVSSVPRILKNLRIGPLVEAVRPGLTVSQLLALLVLDEDGRAPLPMSAVADNLGVALPTATGLIDRLVRDGLAERATSEVDRRVVLVRLTSDGSATVRKFLGLLQQMSAGVMAQMEWEEREALVRAFQRVDALTLQIQRAQRRLVSRRSGRTLVVDKEVQS